MLSASKRERLNNLLLGDKDKIFPQAAIQPNCHLFSIFPHLSFSYSSETLHGPAAIRTFPYQVSERNVMAINSILLIWARENSTKEGLIN